MHVSVVSWKRSLITFKYNSDPYSITILLQNGIIEGREYEESSTLTFPVESYPGEWSVLSNNNMYIFFLSHIVIRRRTIPHADQLRVVSTAWHWLSHGKAWHVLRWCVRFLIRIVLELTKRFDFSVHLYSYKSPWKLQRTSRFRVWRFLRSKWLLNRRTAKP